MLVFRTVRSRAECSFPVGHPAADGKLQIRRLHLCITTATQRVTFAIRGLDCASCAIDVGRALRKMPGVVEININYVVDRGYVEFDVAQTSWDIVSKALRDRSYTVAKTR